MRTHEAAEFGSIRRIREALGQSVYMWLREGLHPEYLMTLAKQGRFPKPVKYAAESNSSVRFVEAEVSAWIEARIAERDALPVTEGA